MMIITAIDSELQSLVNYLNKHYRTNKHATLVVLPGHDCIQAGEKTAWAAYDPEDHVIWVPGIPPSIKALTYEENMTVYYEHLVHEYVHHIQASEGRSFDEEEAESRAEQIVREWQIRRNRWRMLWVSFSRSDYMAGMFFTAERIYVKGKWTPFVRLQKRYKSWFGFWGR